MSIQDHYENLLARHYTWMSGGHAVKVPECVLLFQRLGITPRGSGKALDLACGPGFQSLALAELGFEVLSIDTSAALLEELRERAAGKRVTALQLDMREASVYAARGPFEVAVCMGDSLTHLSSFEEVSALLKSVHACLEPGGKLVLSFRDLSHELKGIDRALPVQSDADKIMTVFLEYDAEHVNVHDMIYVRENGAWTFHKSGYKKLRLSAERVVDCLGEIGFQNVGHEMERGLSTIVAKR